MSAPRIRTRIICARCHKTRGHAARGLCFPCWRYAGATGQRDKWPAQRPQQRTIAEAGQAIEALAAAGHNLGEIAQQLGYKDRWVVASMRYKARKAAGVER